MLNRSCIISLLGAVTVLFAVLSDANGQLVPIHEYRFAGNGVDSVGVADGNVGSNISFTIDGVPAGLGAAMVVGTNGTAPNNVISVPNGDFVDFGMSDFSIAFWAKREQADSGNGDGICDALSGNGRGWQINFTSDDFLRIRLDDNNGATANFDSTAAITDSEWHHYLVTVDRDQTDGLKWYIDGALDSSHDPTAISDNINPNQALWIGGINDDNIQGLDGELALLQVYDSALTDSDAARLKVIGFPIHQYDFEGDGVDSAGAANGAVGANVTFNNIRVPKKLGQAAVIGSDGSTADNRIDVPMADFTNFGTTDFSISMWVKRDENSATTQGILDNLGTDGTQIQFLASDIVRARIDDDMGNEFRPESLSTVTDLGWHHLLLTVDRDAADGAKWYIDGQLDSSSDPTVITGSVLANIDMRFGTINNFGLRGQLAQLAFYDVALTANEAFDLADLDGDGIAFAFDVCDGFDDAGPDADADGIPDDCDACADFDDSIDADGDGAPDPCDLCPGFDDLADADGDSIADGCDVCPGFDDLQDSDADGVPNACDTCLGNSAMGDSDLDGICDDLDVCAGDDALCAGQSDVVYVWANAPGIADGSNWYNAYRDLRAAITSAAANTEIWVAAGTYYADGGHRTIGGTFSAGSGDQGSSINLRPNRAIYGGFLGNETSRDGRDWFANLTILSGDIDGDETSSGNSYHVVRSGDGDDRTAVLDGFVVTGGHANGPGTDNKDGGGLFNDGGSPSIFNCAFLGNFAADDGGGAYGDSFTRDGVLIVSCLFSGNTCNDNGAGIYVIGNPTLINCSLSRNSANDTGGGMFFAGLGSAAIFNCIFWNNSDQNNSQESDQTGTGSADIFVRHSVIQDGWTGSGFNNLSADPLFADDIGPDGVAGTLDDDLSLLPGSPCIDAGERFALLPGAVYDQRGNQRFDNCAVDIGAIESITAALADIDGDGIDDACDQCPGTIPGTEVDASGCAAGDECDRARVIWLGTTIGDLGDNSGLSGDDSSCGINGTIDTLDEWFQHTAIDDGFATFSTCSSATQFDSILAIYDGCPGSGGAQIACNRNFIDENGGCFQSQTNSAATIQWQVTAGTTYYIRVSVTNDDFSSNGGVGSGFALTINICDDADGDFVCDVIDRCPGFDDNVDSDNDNMADGCDACPGFHDGLDDDFDDVPDDCDVCPGFDDNLDADGDGVPDDCDICFGASQTDTDLDGVCDDADACPGFDDAMDADGDGIPNDCDACPTIATGDVNNNTFVDIGDIAAFTAVLLEPTSATADELCAADVNLDGTVDGLDVQGFVDLVITQ